MTIRPMTAAQKFALLDGTPCYREPALLDIQAYRGARDAGLPLPLFQRLDRRGQATRAGPRLLDAAGRRAIESAADQAVFEIARSLRVDEIITRDLRRRHLQG